VKEVYATTHHIDPATYYGFLDPVPAYIRTWHYDAGEVVPYLSVTVVVSLSFDGQDRATSGWVSVWEREQPGTARWSHLRADRRRRLVDRALRKHPGWRRRPGHRATEEPGLVKYRGLDRPEAAVTTHYPLIPEVTTVVTATSEGTDQ